MLKFFDGQRFQVSYSFRQTKINNFTSQLFVQNNILQFYVSMNDFLTVNINQSFGYFEYQTIVLDSLKLQD